MFLHVSDIIKSWACIYICWLISRDECVSACVDWYQRMERVSACVCTYQEPSVYLHEFALFESWACLSMCLHTWGLRVWLYAFEGIKSWECVCMCCACLESGIFLHLSRADRVYLHVGQYREVSVCKHVSACIESLACTCMCWVCIIMCVGQYHTSYLYAYMNTY